MNLDVIVRTGEVLMVAAVLLLVGCLLSGLKYKRMKPQGRETTLQRDLAFAPKAKAPDCCASRSGTIVSIDAA